MQFGVLEGCRLLMGVIAMNSVLRICRDDIEQIYNQNMTNTVISTHVSCSYCYRDSSIGANRQLARNNSKTSQDGQ